MAPRTSFGDDGEVREKMGLLLEQGAVEERGLSIGGVILGFGTLTGSIGLDNDKI